MFSLLPHIYHGVGCQAAHARNVTHNFNPTTTCIAQAPIIDRFELAEVADQNHREIAKGVLVRVQASLAEICPFGLLGSEMHFRKENSANERYFIDDE